MPDLITSSLTNAFNSIDSALVNSTNAVNNALADITAQSLGITKINIGFMTLENVGGPVGPGVTLSIASNTSEETNIRWGAVWSANGTLVACYCYRIRCTSRAQLISFVPADSWSYANNTLTLFAGGTMTDTVIVNDPVGFYGVGAWNE